MKKIIKIYEQGVDESLSSIKKILKSTGMSQPELFEIYKETLHATSNLIINKWMIGRKYARTFFVKKAFQSYYPEKYLKFSLTLDAMVNILDDFYDENLSKEEKAMYLIEFIRVYSLNQFNMPNNKIILSIGNYCSKLITLALAENIILNKIKNEKKLLFLIKYSSDLLLCRAMDIDIFNEIALINKQNESLKKEIIKMGQIFRSINILKKDIKDIKYDKQNNIESVVTNVYDRKDICFEEYIKVLVEELRKETEKIKINEANKKIIINYKKMLDQECKEIEKIKI